MKKIEFIGPSGIGKTSIYDKLVEIDTNKRVWRTTEELRIRLAKKTAFRSLSFVQKLFWVCLKLGIFPRVHSALASIILKGYIKERINSRMNKYNGLIYIMLKTILPQNDNHEVYKKALYIRFYMDLLINNNVALEDVDDNETVVYNEGIVRNSYGLIHNDCFEIMMEKSPDILKYILPAGIVFCTLNIEEQLKRRKKRISDGRVSFLEYNLTHEELFEKCKEEIEDSNKKMELMLRLGVPVLTVDLSAPVEYNVPLINDFINHIARNG